MAIGRKVFLFLIFVSLSHPPIFADDFCEPEGNFAGLKIPKAILDSGPLLVQTQLNSRSSTFHEFGGTGTDKKVEVPITFRNRVDQDKIRELQTPHYDASNDAGLILMFRAPSSFSLRDCGENSATISETAANSMVNPNYLVNPQGGYRYTQAKGINRTREMKFEKGDCQSSMSIGIRAFQLIGGPGKDLIAYAVSDRVIESYHALRGFEDPYGRRKAGYDTAGASLRDQNGNTFNAKLGQYYLLPIRIKYDEYKTLFDGSDSKIKLNVGGQVLVPVSQPFGEAAVGVFANVNWTKAINEDWAATVGAGLGLNIQKNILGGYQASDQKANVVVDGHFAGAVTRYDHDRKGMTSFVVDVGAQTPLLNSSSYLKDNKTTNFSSALGQQASTSMEYGITVAITRSWGDSSLPDRNSVTVHCKEDFKGKGWALNGNNNEDFRCGVQYTRKF